MAARLLKKHNLMIIDTKKSKKCQSVKENKNQSPSPEQKR